MSMHWVDLTTEARIEAIKAVYEPGMSASEIAASIGGPTRNAIIGMYGRYSKQLEQFPLRPFRTCSTKPRTGRKLPKRKKPNTPFIPEAVFEPTYSGDQTCGRPIVMLDSRQCRWPVNDADRGELHLFCGAPSDGVFCPHHSSIAYREP